jgi:hypothetical protein
VSRQSLAKAHRKIQQLAWEPVHHEPYMKDGTDYTFRKAQKKDRREDRESYAEMWRRWVQDDYYRSHLVPPEKHGLTVPHDLRWSRCC